MGIEIGFAVGALFLFGALIFGMRSYSTRNPANDAITEQATKQLYSDPDRYEAEGKDQLKRQLRP